MLYFLGDASKAFNNHFSKELHKISNSEITLGPTVIMFHETNFTNVLPQADERTGKSPETIIRDHIASLDQVIYNLNILNWVPQPYNKHRPKTRLYRGLSVKTCWDTLCRRYCTKSIFSFRSRILLHSPGCVILG